LAAARGWGRRSQPKIMPETAAEEGSQRRRRSESKTTALRVSEIKIGTQARERCSQAIRAEIIKSGQKRLLVERPKKRNERKRERTWGRAIKRRKKKSPEEKTKITVQKRG